ncbi:uncharacterized protein FIBRA_05694 [Fibroporia radiculosa]|uniref:Uncharacterized protein n=1 Tax=Fibroporia radiculosa TaxID=599839 RepID=J4G9Y2_9APHY|nr:uncharacterized protein FIBRA_05694 [Fibroporia radiculosa]CCM03558.1 predicted protein [Fibroporia radiculosa]
MTVFPQYSACDITLLLQIYYYRWTNPQSAETPVLVPEASIISDLSEETPLLSGDDADSGQQAQALVLHEFLRYAGALLFVFAVGVAAWAVNDFIYAGQTRPKPKEEVIEWRSQVLGWISAAMYLGARVPQIVKNFKSKCEGLSPFLFIYSITGNTTYVLSILTVSMNAKHLTVNASWLAGSALTVFLDVFVLCQFVYYRAVQKRNARARMS